MKCSLEFNGTAHESTEFTERQVSGLIASIGAWGVNIRDVFEKTFGGDMVTASIWTDAGAKTLFRDYTMEQADQNIAYLLKSVFPTLDVPVASLGTGDLITIASPMVLALGQSLQAEAQAQAEPKPEVEPIDLGLILWPEVIQDISPTESVGIDDTAARLGVSSELVICWHQWYQVFKTLDIDSEEVDENGLVELVSDQSQIPIELSRRIHDQMIAPIAVVA